MLLKLFRLKSTLGKLRSSGPHSLQWRRYTMSAPTPAPTPIPSTRNWCGCNAVVKNQGPYGLCATYASVTAAEYLLSRYGNISVTLSVQDVWEGLSRELLTCANIFWILDWIRTRGIMEESDYPYTGKLGIWNRGSHPRLHFPIMTVTRLFLKFPLLYPDLPANMTQIDPSTFKKFLSYSPVVCALIVGPNFLKIKSDGMYLGEDSLFHENYVKYRDSLSNQGEEGLKGKKKIYPRKDLWKMFYFNHEEDINDEEGQNEDNDAEQFGINFHAMTMICTEKIRGEMHYVFHNSHGINFGDEGRCVIPHKALLQQITQAYVILPETVATKKEFDDWLQKHTDYPKNEPGNAVNISKMDGEKEFAAVKKDEQTSSIALASKMVESMKLLPSQMRLREVSILSEGFSEKEKVVAGAPEFCIDAGLTGNVARFINHSCEPNLFVQCVLSSHHDIKLARVMLFAADNIPPLQELTYDYGYALDSVIGQDGKVKQMACYCGAPGCRKRLF